MNVKTGPCQEMLLADLLRDFRDGEEHGWQTEFDWLDTHHAHRLDSLMTSVQQVGILTPILLGNDGRVWDGHHRIAVAHRLGIETVPVTRIPSNTNLPCECRCPCSCTHAECFGGWLDEDIINHRNGQTYTASDCCPRCSAYLVETARQRNSGRPW